MVNAQRATIYNIIKREKHLNLLTGSRRVKGAANVSSYARAIACTNHSLQRLLAADLVVFRFHVDFQTFFVSPE